ncbi:jg13648 [Pararge aegeria aegeria]|uniref:Jg13648 protein n=1 Tax=Pararge aegeria aegeria TaxID=348720 RepID=A0A8S4SR21_9NEOP|nr:jg13648 [Pararge aegeria aegeria]
MEVGVPRCWSGNLAPVNAALVDPQPGWQTKSSESRGAAGYKRHRIVEFGTPYKTPMSSQQLQQQWTSIGCYDDYFYDTFSRHKMIPLGSNVSRDDLLVGIVRKWYKIMYIIYKIVLFWWEALAVASYQPTDRDLVFRCDVA